MARSAWHQADHAVKAAIARGGCGKAARAAEPIEILKMMLYSGLTAKAAWQAV
jgi:hypothetical protein